MQRLMLTILLHVLNVILLVFIAMEYIKIIAPNVKGINIYDRHSVKLIVNLTISKVVRIFVLFVFKIVLLVMGLNTIIAYLVKIKESL